MNVSKSKDQSLTFSTADVHAMFMNKCTVITVKSKYVNMSTANPNVSKVIISW